MRIVSFILGLLLSLVVLGASLFAIGASTLGEMVGETATAESMITSGVLGFFLSIFGIIGASLAFKHKVTSAVVLFLTMVFLILVGNYTVHKNMIVFGGLFFLPAIFAAVSKKMTIRHPYRPPMQETTPEQSNPQVSSEERGEHLQSLLKQATNLKDSDIDTAIRIVEQVVEEYEKNNESFESIRPIYFKLAHYLQKKRDRDGAWKIYNKMLLDIMGEDPQFMGIYQGQIYSRMALLREKEKAYKDAARLRIQSYISTNTALHLQDRKEEVTPTGELHEQLRVLFKRGSMEYPERFLEKTLNPLVKKLRKKGPVREPFLETPKKNVKIKRQFGVLSKHTSEIIQEIQKEFSKLKQKSIGMEK